MHNIPKIGIEDIEIASTTNDKFLPELITGGILHKSFKCFHLVQKPIPT